MADIVAGIATSHVPFLAMHPQFELAEEGQRNRVVAGLDEARKLLSHIGGGATAYPPADGNWVDEKGENLWEQTRIVFCYIFDHAT